MQNVNVTIRQVKRTGEYELFFANDRVGEPYYWIEGYSRMDGHFQPSRAYLRQHTTAVKTLYKPALDLIKHWSTLGHEKYACKPVARLVGPRGKMYGGE